MKKPVLLILFNRLNTTQQVFASIKNYKPEKLYISADGPRVHKEGEKILTEQVRKWVLESIDWKCEVKTLFHDNNLGCGRAPAKAISWFFEQENDGIILEDDCVPSSGFFKFCETMLEYYNDDKRISIISGCNFDLKKTYCTDDSYFFSVYPYTWGWATWKRNWQGYDYEIKEWQKINRNKFLNNISTQKKYKQPWQLLFDKLSNNVPNDIWDYQFFFQCFKRQQLAVVPNANLVTNIGAGEMATHTFNQDNPKMNIVTEPIKFPLTHPQNFKRNVNYDNFLQELNYGVVEQVSFIKKIKRVIKKNIIRKA
jgi:hypothetical protein